MAQFSWKKNRKLPLLAGFLALALGAWGIHWQTQNSYAKRYERAYFLMQKGDFGQAISLLEKAVTAAPSDAGAHFGLGWAYHSRGRIAEAKREYEIAQSQAESTLSFTAFNRGVIAQAERKWGEAEFFYRRVLAITPKAPNAMLNLSFVLAEIATLAEKQGNKAMARAHLKEAIALNPRTPAFQERLNKL